MLNANADLGLITPIYTFATPVLGDQAAPGMTAIVGHTDTSLAGALTASVPPFTFVRSDSVSDSATGVGDLYPIATMKWHQGVNNFMVYRMGDIPVGNYSSS